MEQRCREQSRRGRAPPPHPPPLPPLPPPAPMLAQSPLTTPPPVSGEFAFQHQTNHETRPWRASPLATAGALTY